MVELLSHTILAAVCLLLAIGLIRQFSVLGSRGALLDQLAVVPQWKFFAHHQIDDDIATFDDPHILARIGKADGSMTGWSEIWSARDRTLLSTLWNPSLRRDTIIIEAALLLGKSDRDKRSPILPTGLAYLTILRLCINKMRPQPGEIVQFAVATTRSTEIRAVSLRFLSSWHSE